MTSPEPRPAVVALVGPTAVGKSRLALALAEQVPLEIVAADSRTVYRGLDIGTAKPTAAERAQVPHHLLDVVDPDADYTLALYQAAARSAVRDIVARGRLPLLVGGAGLYVDAVADGLRLPDVPPDPALRAALEARAEAEGWQALQADLAAVDPVSAARIDPRNVRRVIRALEVTRLTGTPFSAWQQPGPAPFQATRIGLDLDRAQLDARIEARIDGWLAEGFVDEVRGLLARGYDPRLPSLSGIGYREVAAMLRGELTLAEASARMKQATRQYARRQLTWFRRDQRVVWLDAATATISDLRALLPT